MALYQVTLSGAVLVEAGSEADAIWYALDMTPVLEAEYVLLLEEDDEEDE